ncbi:hypothetical protein AVEN_56204-1 [Araneus ventricosus]|uniref:Uncharacterized protein n=1 Tax=Araneus ventricosus TaxID=182803 RepID=A0A4Y2P3V1_ARAVE|nr:hypothetical protein AVEN_56204-1 [Araneus ventricosus]
MALFVLVGESFVDFFLFVTSLKSVKSREAEAFSHNGATDGKEGNYRLVTAGGVLGLETDCLEREAEDISGLRKSPGRPRHVRTPENVAAVRDAVTQSPRRSARKQASALRLSQRSLRRILHGDLKFHPYKIMLVQEMKECDWPNRKKCCEVLLENVAPDDVVLSSDEAHCPDALISKSSATGLKAIHAKSMSDLCIANMLLFGALYHIWV